MREGEPCELWSSPAPVLLFAGLGRFEARAFLFEPYVLLLSLGCFLGPLVGIARIRNYGVRYVVPGVLPVIAGAVVVVAPPRPPSAVL